MSGNDGDSIDFTIGDSNKISNLEGKLSILIGITSLNFVGTAALFITLISMIF